MDNEPSTSTVELASDTRPSPLPGLRLELLVDRWMVIDIQTDRQIDAKRWRYAEKINKQRGIDRQTHRKTG